MWALGVVMYECCMGHYPFDVENNNQVALIRKIARGVFKPVSVSAGEPDGGTRPRATRLTRRLPCRGMGTGIGDGLRANSFRFVCTSNQRIMQLKATPYTGSSAATTCLPTGRRRHCHHVSRPPHAPRSLQGPYTQQLIQLITSCLTLDPRQRPDTTALLRNPSLVAKAGALKIDLNPQPASAKEDKPVYEQRGGVATAPPPQQQVGTPPRGVPGPPEHPFASPHGGGGGAPPPYPAQPSPHSPYPYQQGQIPYLPHQRPGSGRSPGPGPGDHPFSLPGGQQAPPYGAYPSPQHQQPPQQQQGGYGGGYSPPQPYGHQQQQPSPRGSPYAQQQRGYNGYGGDPYDQLAGDINRMHLRESEVARNNVERAQVGGDRVQCGAVTAESSKAAGRGYLAQGHCCCRCGTEVGCWGDGFWRGRPCSDGCAYLLARTDVMMLCLFATQQVQANAHAGRMDHAKVRTLDWRWRANGSGATGAWQRPSHSSCRVALGRTQC